MKGFFFENLHIFTCCAHQNLALAADWLAILENTFFFFFKNFLGNVKSVAMSCKLAQILNMCLYKYVNKLISFNYL